MDWDAVRFDWNRARAFLVTAEEGSLSAAARALGMAQPTLSRQVTALEHELRTRLFERVGRGLTLTESGLELLDHVRRMGEAARGVALSTSGQAPALEGNVSIAASAMVAAFVLPALLARLRSEQPGIELTLLVSASRSEPLPREADVTLLGRNPGDVAGAVRKLRPLSARAYATASYLKQLASAGQAPSSESGLVRVDDQLVSWELAKLGLGVATMLEEVGDAEPRVQRVLPDAAVFLPLWLVASRAAERQRPLRAVLDLLEHELS